MPSLPNCKIKSKDWYCAINIACKDGKHVPHKLCKAASVDSSGYYKYVKRASKKTITAEFSNKVLADIQHLQNLHKRELVIDK